MREFTDVHNEVARQLAMLERYVTEERLWPQRYELGAQARGRHVSRAELDEWTEAWCTISRDLPHGVTVCWTPEGLGPRRPESLEVADVYAGARFVGAEWPLRADRAREVLSALGSAGLVPSGADLKRILRDLSSEKFTLDDLARATRWLVTHDDLSIWTARRAGPDACLPSKWFERNGSLLKSLWRRDVVAAMTGRPRTILFSYVDPDYLARGRVRRHDSWTTGDELVLPYSPRVVVIVENKDSRFSFPGLRGGVVVYGGGDAAPAFLAEITWPEPQPMIVYWGDMDRDGFEILAGMRRAFPGRVRPLFMDRRAYERYHSRGSNVDEAGRPIPAGRREVPLDLDLPELEADRLACADGPVRRIEQEAIPDAHVIEAISSL